MSEPLQHCGIRKFTSENGIADACKKFPIPHPYWMAYEEHK